MSIQFVVDSASDILPQEAAALGLTHIPLTVTIDGREYRDGTDLTHAQFYKMLATAAQLPRTSQATPADFAAAFQSIVDRGDTAVAITLSAALSGTYQSACIAAQDFPDRAFVVDSMSASLGERLLVLRALQLRQNSAARIVDQLNAERRSIRLLAMPETLEYLQKGGRISAAAAFAGGLLGVRPVITIRDGAIALYGKARGSKNGNNLLRRFIQSGNGVDFARPYALAYSGFSDAALQRYISDSADLWQSDAAHLPIVTVGSAIGTHIGPGAFAVAYFEKDTP